MCNPSRIGSHSKDTAAKGREQNRKKKNNQTKAHKHKTHKAHNTNNTERETTHEIQMEKKQTLSDT